jgi:hypothetical protein
MSHSTKNQKPVAANSSAPTPSQKPTPGKITDDAPRAAGFRIVLNTGGGYVIVGCGAPKTTLDDGHDNDVATRH